MTPIFPNETPAYRAARTALLAREVELRRAMEAVAVARRALPPGGEVPQDYAFRGRTADGTIGTVPLSSLFRNGDGAVAIYNFMFPRNASDRRVGPAAGSTAALPLTEAPCPSCTALLDQLDGAAPHLAERIGFAVVAKTSAERLLAFGEERGWRNLRLLSSAENSYNRDYFGESESGSQQPMLNVFERTDGVIRHFWGAELLYAPMEEGQEMRHVGTLEPLWNMLDMTREGRGTDWDEQLDYRCCHEG